MCEMHLNFAFLRLVPQNKAIEFINNYHWNEYGLYRTSPFTSSISSFLRIFFSSVSGHAQATLWLPGLLICALRRLCMPPNGAQNSEKGC